LIQSSRAKERREDIESNKVVECVTFSTVRITGGSYENPFNTLYCIDHSEPDKLSISDITDTDDVNTYPSDVIDDADLSSPRGSLSCELFR